MKFKVKFRVINEAGKDQKFSINLEEDKVFVLGKTVPGIKHAIGTLVLRDGNLFLNDRKATEKLILNDVVGSEFHLKAGDFAKSGGISIEFLQVPVAERPRNAETQFIDVGDALRDPTKMTKLASLQAKSEATSEEPKAEESAPTADTAGAEPTSESADAVEPGKAMPMPLEPLVADLPDIASSIEAPAETAEVAESEAESHDSPELEEAAVAEADELPAEEEAPAEEAVETAEAEESAEPAYAAAVATPDPEYTIARPARGNAHLPEGGTSIRGRLAEPKAGSKTKEPARPARSSAPVEPVPGQRTGRLSLSDFTGMLIRRPGTAHEVRGEYFTLFGLIFLALGVTGGAARVGSPILWGVCGTLVCAMLASVIRSFNDFAGAKHTYLEYLRVLALVSFGMVPWGYAFRYPMWAPIVATVLILVASAVLFFTRFRGDQRRILLLGAGVGLVPALVAGVLLYTQIHTGVIPAIDIAAVPLPNPGVNAPNPAAVDPATDTSANPASPVAANTLPPNGGAVDPSQITAPVAQTAPVNPVQPTTPVATAPVAQAASPTQTAPVQNQMVGQAVAPGAVKGLPEDLQIAPKKEPTVQDPLAVEQFFSAARSGNLTIVKRLIDSKAVDPNFTLERGSTVLMHAAASGHAKVVKYLLAIRTNPNAQDPNGTTALMWATYKGHTEVVRTLLQYGADARVKRDDGTRAADIARAWRRPEIMALLQGAEARRAIASKPQKRKPAPKTHNRRVAPRYQGSTGMEIYPSTQ